MAGNKSRPYVNFVFSMAVLLLVFIAAVGAELLAPYAPYEQHVHQRLMGPLTPGHLLGTDSLGRDVLSRLLYGARSALLVGGVSCASAALLGAIVALPAAFGPSWLSSLLMLFMDGILAIPTVITAIAVVAVFGYGLIPVMIALGIVFSPLIARLAKAELQRAWGEDFVEAELAVNRSPASVLAKVVLPRIIGPILVQLTSLFSAAVTLEASLSFLGIGIQPPQASWGSMLNAARDYLLSDPWLAFPPGIALALTVYALNTLGDQLEVNIGH